MSFLEQNYLFLIWVYLCYTSEFSILWLNQLYFVISALHFLLNLRCFPYYLVLRISTQLFSLYFQFLLSTFHMHIHSFCNNFDYICKVFNIFDFLHLINTIFNHVSSFFHSFFFKTLAPFFHLLQVFFVA